MIKEQASMPVNPVATIELTDEELEGMRGGHHHDHNGDHGSHRDYSRHGHDYGDRGHDDYRHSFRGYDHGYDRGW